MSRNGPDIWVMSTITIPYKLLRFKCSKVNFIYYQFHKNTVLPSYGKICTFRASKSNKLVGFISAVPAHIKMYEKEKAMVEINFLCVHKKLRSKRLAPVLIREITRRVNVKGGFPDLV